jgi:WYL domain
MKSSKPKSKLELELSLKESLKLQEVLGSVVLEHGPIKVVMDLLSQLEAWDQDLSENDQALVKKMDEMIEHQTMVKVTFKDERELILFPKKVFHLEGSLNLVGEDFKDHCLMITTLKDIDWIEEIPSTHKAKASDFEIDEFIMAIRSMSEKETRLILKIFNPTAVNLFPDYQFLGKPCMVTNPNGDLIWAAYVEPCEALFDWLLSLESHVEILDPVKFKQEYLSYCEEKIRKIA